jgi:hypothetical protein
VCEVKKYLSLPVLILTPSFLSSLLSFLFSHSLFSHGEEAGGDERLAEELAEEAADLTAAAREEERASHRSARCRRRLMHWDGMRPTRSPRSLVALVHDDGGRGHRCWCPPWTDAFSASSSTRPGG